MLEDKCTKVLVFGFMGLERLQSIKSQKNRDEPEIVRLLSILRKIKRENVCDMLQSL